VWICVDDVVDVVDIVLDEVDFILAGDVKADTEEGKKLADDWVGVALHCIFGVNVGEEFSPEFELADDFTEIDDVKGGCGVVLLENELNHLIDVEVFVLGVWNEDIVVFEEERKFGILVLYVDHWGFERVWYVVFKYLSD
jgi:hypothetical protein